MSTVISIEPVEPGVVPAGGSDGGGGRVVMAVPTPLLRYGSWSGFARALRRCRWHQRFRCGGPQAPCVGHLAEARLGGARVGSDGEGTAAR